MRTKNKMITLLMVFLLTVMSVLPVYAASNSQDGVSISVTTNQQKYNRNENISVTVNVHNANAFAIENVTVETHTPSGYNFVGDVGTKNMASLGANEAFQMNVSGNTTNLINVGTGSATQTGDYNGIILWSILLMIALMGTVGLSIVYRKNRKGFLSLILCLVLISGLLPANMLQLSAANPNPVQTVSAYETIEVDGKQIEVGASVSFQFPGTDEEDVTEDITDNTTESTTPSTPEAGGNTGTGGENNESSEGGDVGSGDSGSDDSGNGEGGSGGSGSGDSGSEDGGSGDSGSGSGDSGSGDSGDSGSGDSGTTVPDYPENLLTGNGGFENELTDWNPANLTNWTVTANSDSRRTGVGSALLTSSAENAPSAAVTMSYQGTKENLAANTEYTLMAWVRTEAGKPLQTTVADGVPGISVYFNSSDTTATKYNISQPPVSDTEGMWQRISVNFTTKDVTNPTGTVYLRMKEGTYGTVYVDDVALYETAKVNFDAPDKEVDSSSAYPDNLLTGNWGFENNLKDWNDSGLKTWVTKADKEYSHTGKGSALLTVSKENAQSGSVTMAYSGTKETLKANTEYTMMGTYCRTIADDGCKW